MTTFAGYKVIKVDDLPAGTMLVSADVYEALSRTPAEREAQADRLVRNMEAIGDRLREMTGGADRGPEGATHTLNAAGEWFMRSDGRWVPVLQGFHWAYENKAIRIPGTD